MKVKERESWVLTNEGKGGRKSSFEQFNKSLKGNERNPKVKEYASQGMKAYHSYSERADAEVMAAEEKKRQQQQKGNRSSKSNLIKNVVGRVVAVAASTVIIVSTYTTMTGVDSQKWNWSTDFENVSVELVRRDGDVIKELPAVITSETVDPTCNTAGSTTYTATAEDVEEDVVYQDVKSETLLPLGHNYILIEEIVDNGQITRIYECDRCHDRHEIVININEID